MVQTSESPQIALVGLGNAGQALLTALARHWKVHAFDIAAESCRAATQLGPHVPVIATSAAEAVTEADVVILSLPSPAASLAVAADIGPVLAKGAVVVETSTVAPGDVEALHRLVARSGCQAVDAAIVGGTAKLAAGQGTFLVGSPQDEAALAGLVLGRIAEEVVFLAKRGDGMRAKLAVNAVAHAVYVVLVEAGALAAAQGIPTGVYQRLLERESGLMRPLTHRFAQRLRKRDFSGGMAVTNARKDSALAMAAAQESGVRFETIGAAHAAYERAITAGMGGEDYASIAKLWESESGIAFFKTKK
jgi:3-hydroxyisobutyrate dehydrogenase-like beta-hydroxyacid dehydrogenase